MSGATFQDIVDNDIDKFTTELGAWIRLRIPPILSDRDFAAASSALMIALNRQLAATAVAFGETHSVPAEQVRTLVLQQFTNNHRRALATVQAEQAVLQ